MFAKAFFLSAATIAAALTTLVGVASAKTQQAIFAGGCFWCVESDFDQVPGVISTTSGYTGGTSDNPTYEDHTAAGHRETVRIEFDDSKVSYEKLLDVFWHSVDPTDGGGQFCDRGHSYTTAIYAVGKDQLAAAQKSKAQVAGVLKQTIATEIAAAPAFWPAEAYHQDYYRKNPLRYKYYRYACGRDARIETVWGEAAHQGIATH
ncbi:peptide-methionine (S)-S-oxide reductase MsrA [Pseudaminobacter sp. NGMCC 1.201702]|uniref:peptide-methionine (S)-S-oxide reductase MsrA n=1 Tax=Pseudaminobacter sp. NGMCC 1.201702 TaxID=3391825 RepID=UPI0039EEC5B0